jgi:hypothetical protein
MSASRAMARPLVVLNAQPPAVAAGRTEVARRCEARRCAATAERAIARLHKRSPLTACNPEHSAAECSLRLDQMGTAAPCVYRDLSFRRSDRDVTANGANE